MTDSPRTSFDKGRLQALSDGVFSIVMTLLVLDLISLEVTGARSAAELHRVLLELWPKALSYVISFSVAGVFWVAQHADLHHIDHTDNRFLWINLFFLFWISLLPFSAALLGEHHQYEVAPIIYGFNMILATVALNLGWRYAIRHPQLVKPDLDVQLIRQAHRRLLLGQPIYLLGIAIAFYSPHTSYVLYVIVTILYVLSGIVPGRLRFRALSRLDDPD